MLSLSPRVLLLLLAPAALALALLLPPAAAQTATRESPAAALARLKLTLPPAPQPVGSYVPFVRTGNLIYTSGQLPTVDGKLFRTGKVTREVPLADAQQCARLATLNALAVLQQACEGDLSRVVRIVRVGVFVQSPDDFTGQPAVANGASDLLVAVFGDAGKHARAAVGANALPLNTPVEVELLAEIR